MWWKIRIDDPNMGDGWLAMDRDTGPIAMFLDDGTPVLKGIRSYTTVAVDQPAPDWWKDQGSPAVAKFWG